MASHTQPQLRAAAASSPNGHGWKGIACAAAAVVALAAGLTAVASPWGMSVDGGPAYIYSNVFQDWLVFAAACVTSACALGVIIFQACRRRAQCADPHSPVGVILSGMGLLWSILGLCFLIWLFVVKKAFQNWSLLQGYSQAVFIFSFCIGTAVWAVTLLFATQDRAACMAAAPAGACIPAEPFIAVAGTDYLKDNKGVAIV